MSRVIWLFAVLAALFFAPQAQASGDVGCNSTMKVFFNYFTGCDSMGFLSPGNDTRVNLVFLQADGQAQKLALVPQKPDPDSTVSNFTPADWASFSASLTQDHPGQDDSSSGEGTICVSDAKGRADFVAAVAADKDITDSEKASLTNARQTLICTDGTSKNAAAPVPSAVQSPNAKDFAAYLAAVIKFYQVSHADPTDFVALANSPQPWVKEAAHYMQARVALLAAQAEAFSDYGTLQKDKIDQTKVKAAIEALDDYLKDYPEGAYAASATGLLRRAAWLAGDGAGQLGGYSKALAKAPVNDQSLALISELDSKLPAEAYVGEGADPLFLAVEDLRQMRLQFDDAGKPKPGMVANVIEAQKGRFAGQDDLYNYLLAARAWFEDKDAKTVLALLPEKAPSTDLSYLEFSRQLLRAAALDASGDKAARPAYVALFPLAAQPYQRGTLELALAMSDERNKNISAVFAADSLIKEPQVREQALNYVVGPILLRQQATAKDVPQDERDTALYRLFSRDLVQGHFKGFLEDMKLLPPKPEANADGNVVDKFEAFRWEGNKDGYACPDLPGVVQRLVAKAGDVQARLCLGDFFRSTGTGDIGIPDKEALGGIGTLFAGAPLARQEIYIDIMKDPKAAHDDKAYALFRAVHCYEPAHANDCGGKDVDLPVRKAWHDELKARYGDTSWAKELHYYW